MRPMRKAHRSIRITPDPPYPPNHHLLLRLRCEEQLGPAAIARRLGIGRASVYRVLGKQATTVRRNGDFDADQA